MSEEEWRDIPGFPNHEVTAEGDVRVKKTGRLLKEVENKATGSYFYSLMKDGKSHSKRYQELIYSAFPELLEGWFEIPGYPNYLINNSFEVMTKRSWKVVKQTKYGRVRLAKDKKYYHVKVTDLAYEVAMAQKQAA